MERKGRGERKVKTPPQSIPVYAPDRCGAGVLLQLMRQQLWIEIREVIIRLVNAVVIGNDCGGCIR